MTTQMVFTLDTSTKKKFMKNLKEEGMTSKAFFLQCIKAYNEKKFSFSLVPHHESFSQDIDVNETIDNVLAFMEKSHERTAKTVGKTTKGV